jgi:hypothetical protein
MGGRVAPAPVARALVEVTCSCSIACRAGPQNRHAKVVTVYNDARAAMQVRGGQPGAGAGGSELGRRRGEQALHQSRIVVAACLRAAGVYTRAGRAPGRKVASRGTRDPPIRRGQQCHRRMSFCSQPRPASLAAGSWLGQRSHFPPSRARRARADHKPSRACIATRLRRRGSAPAMGGSAEVSAFNVRAFRLTTHALMRFAIDENGRSSTPTAREVPEGCPACLLCSCSPAASMFQTRRFPLCPHAWRPAADSAACVKQQHA